MIFFRRGQKGVDKAGQPVMYDYETRINNAVFPALQGGPHAHQIAGIATQLKEVMTPEFKAYIQQVKKNAVALSDTLRCEQ